MLYWWFIRCNNIGPEFGSMMWVISCILGEEEEVMKSLISPSLVLYHMVRYWSTMRNWWESSSSSTQNGWKITSFSSKIALKSISKKKKTLKTNITKNTTIKNNNQSRGDDEHWPAHWPVLLHSGGDGRYNTLAGRCNWLKLLHMTEKHIKKHRKQWKNS